MHTSKYNTFVEMSLDFKSKNGNNKHGTHNIYFCVLNTPVVLPFVWFSECRRWICCRRGFYHTPGHKIITIRICHFQKNVKIFNHSNGKYKSHIRFNLLGIQFLLTLYLHLLYSIVYSPYITLYGRIVDNISSSEQYWLVNIYFLILTAWE